MWKVAKYKLYGILQNKINIYIIILLITTFNYKILRCGILLPVDECFTVLDKYKLLIGNYMNIIKGIGFIFSIYLGVTIIDDDIKSGKINIMLISFEKRWKYLQGDLIGVSLSTVLIIILLTLNYLVYSIVFNININLSDLISCNIRVMFNMMTITLVASLISLFLNKKLSIFISIIGLIAFNIYTYNIIPIIEKQVQIKMTIRRGVAMIFPITHPYAESIYSYEFQKPCIVKPYIFENMEIYQIIYIILIVLVLLFYFERKEI